MRLMKKAMGTAAALALSVSLLAGCGSAADTASAAESTPAESTVSSAAESEPAESTSAASEAAAEPAESEAADENKAAAAKLLDDLTGSYQELWPVILADEYTQTWLDDCAPLVGEENAEAAYEKLSSMVTGDVYGEEAVTAYANGGGAYFCGFTQDMVTLTVDGASSTISGTDKDGSELFSHTYHYVGMEPVRGLYEFESDDADSGEFTYFYFAPDTSDETYHIEFRYGSDAEALGQYDAGNYAYWLASGIATDCDETMINNCIELFCTENLAG